VLSLAQIEDGRDEHEREQHRVDQALGASARRHRGAPEGQEQGQQQQAEAAADEP